MQAIEMNKDQAHEWIEKIFANSKTVSFVEAPDSCNGPEESPFTLLDELRAMAENAGVELRKSTEKLEETCPCPDNEEEQAKDEYRSRLISEALDLGLEGKIDAKAIEEAIIKRVNLHAAARRKACKEEAMCKNCLFAVYESEPDEYFCRRYPPSLGEDDCERILNVNRDGWCGEWK